MVPMLGRLAQFGMDELILGYEETRKYTHSNEDGCISHGGQSEDHPEDRSKHRKRIQWMAEAFPSWQPAAEMEPELVHQNGEPLHHQREKKQIFHGSIMA